MKRQEVMAIIGAYSRQGFNAAPAAGGFWVDSSNVHEYRTAREARRDTGVTIYYTTAELSRQVKDAKREWYGKGATA